MTFVLSCLARSLEIARVRVKSNGQVTLDPGMLKRLGVKPGDEINVEILPDGLMTVKAAAGNGSLDRFFGCLSNDQDLHYSMEELSEQISGAWAGKR